MKIAVYAALSLLLVSAAAAESLIEGSYEAGEAKAIVCGACHGPGGNSVNPAWPSIAGQHGGYFAQELREFKSGARTNVLMTGQAMMLSEEDMQNLAVYYSAQEAAAKSVLDAKTVNKGQALYRGGNKENGVSACIACHGPAGNGNPAAKYPDISGQYAQYLAQTLRDYANGTRKSDKPTRIMRDIAAKMSEDEILAVASYVQGLH
jgi:cytochrome c553